MMKIHVVTGGETPRDVTERFTGSTNRVGELVAANPEWPRVKAAGMVGSPITFDPSFWRDGVHVNIPETWADEGGGNVGAPYGFSAPPKRPKSNGTVGLDLSNVEKDMSDAISSSGGTCSYGTISDIKEYRYELQEDDSPGIAALTVKWGLPSRRWTDISKANNQIPHTYYGTGSTKHCEPDRTKLVAGRLLNIPKSWPDPPESLWSRLKNHDGSPYTPGGTGGGGGGGGEGTDGIAPSSWYGDSGAEGWLWPVLIVGAAALGGVALIGATKKGKAR